MKVEKLNELVNDLAVLRLEKNLIEDTIQSFLDTNKEYQKLLKKAEELGAQKSAVENQLLLSMRDAELKSWKTEQCGVSRATRYYASVDPEYKKQVEVKLKSGKEVAGWHMKKTEYISIRSNPKTDENK